ncbi:methyl-accepting chemotaxis protein [Marinospirillum perlucidum]|uniref:methyl-accepting chemotaxis protein n=1 Tax=Marinospirillum perlucidum TaxID=1982602 RepID=UPI000DF3294C|nr:methyl-accepting chemotaxis protein [Marinospirillum perlucidum]
MLIKHKLILNAVLAAISLLVLFGLMAWSLNTLERLANGQQLAQKLETQMLTLRRHEKDFLMRQDTKYLTRFDATQEEIRQLLNQLRALGNDYEMDLGSLNALEATFSEYQGLFHELVATTEEIGLDHESGLQGALRSAVHDVEETLEAMNADTILVTLLQLRRAEKDFILRGLEKYPQRFDDLIVQLRSQLQERNVPGATFTLVDQYQNRFQDFVAGHRQLGLSSEEGLRGEMRSAIHQTETLLEELVLALEEGLSNRISQAHTLGLGLFVLVLIITCVTTLLIGRSIFKPIRQLVADIRQIDLTHNLALRVHQEGKDEISAMGAGLNQMLAGFQEVIKKVNAAVATMNATTGELSQNASRTSDDIARQREETELVATAITEMVSTIEEIASNTEHMAANANSTHENALSGQAQIQEAISVIHHLSDQLEGSVQSVSQLAEQSQTIGEVLGVIGDIAEQTNLLALNAAIEAARAGDQGRGFAVVADEVRALAARTQDATQEINDIITALQGKTEETVRVIHQCREDGQSSREQAGRAEAILDSITEEVTDISQRATQVAAAIEEQSGVANEVGQNVVAIRDITDQAADAVQSNAQASDAIASQARELQKVVSEFKV